MQQYGVDQGEDGRVGADPQRQRQQSGDRVARSLAQLAECITQILQENSHRFISTDVSPHRQKRTSRTTGLLESSLDGSAAILGETAPLRWTEKGPSGLAVPCRPASPGGTVRADRDATTGGRSADTHEGSRRHDSILINSTSNTSMPFGAPCAPA